MLKSLWFSDNVEFTCLMQPGYLHKLLPDSAPDHPETLDQVLDGEYPFSSFGAFLMNIDTN